MVVFPEHRRSNEDSSKEIIMKSFLLFLALLFVMTLSSSAPSVTNAANAVNKQKAVMNFEYKVTLMDVALKGEYLFVHDDAAMARGEACTYVYKGLNETPKNLVVSFHCTPAARAKAENFTVRTLMVSPGEYELMEFQFAGSKEAHLVPISIHIGHVSIAPLN
jgi:hypothetical protein